MWGVNDIFGYANCLVAMINKFCNVPQGWGTGWFSPIRQTCSPNRSWRRSWGGWEPRQLGLILQVRDCHGITSQWVNMVHVWAERSVCIMLIAEWKDVLLQCNKLLRLPSSQMYRNVNNRRINDGKWNDYQKLWKRMALIVWYCVW